MLVQIRDGILSFLQPEMTFYVPICADDDIYFNDDQTLYGEEKLIKSLIHNHTSRYL